jgi:hypothetical protein
MVASDTSKPISCWRRNARVEIGAYALFLAKYGNLECDGHLSQSKTLSDVSYFFEAYLLH